MDYKQIQHLIKMVNKNKISEIKIEREDFKITIRSQDGDAPKVITSNQVPQQLVQTIAVPEAVQQPVQAPVAAAAPVASPPAVEEVNAGLIEIKSPMIGTFYRAPGPDKDPFVAVGDNINVGDVICMVEAMKLFNDIESEVTGKVVKILVEDATPVEFDQVLFLLEAN